MANSIETTARERMRTILQGVFSDQSRIILGLDDIGPSDPDFFDNLVSCGPMAYILGAEQTNLDAVNRLYEFTVKVKIHYAFSPDQDEEYKGINDFIKECWVALNSRTAYTDCLPPSSPNGFKKVSDVQHKGAVAGPVGYYEAIYSFIAGADCE